MDEAQEYIKHFVWSGFYTSDEITEIVCEEVFEPGELNRDSVKKAIEDEFEQKRKAEDKWPEVTDCDKLDQVFQNLNRSGIIALQNAGYTQSDGIDDITEVYHAMGREESDIFGYCFYHGQDLERAVLGQGLFLTFGDIHGTDEKGIEVGKVIADAFKEAGFDVEWDGTISQRIKLTNITWQRRGKGA